VPTLFEWMGGLPALERLIDTFYERVPKDPVLGPVFATMSPEHAKHVTAFIAEVLGGPTAYATSSGARASP
jgi:hemoglobin